MTQSERALCVDGDRGRMACEYSRYVCVLLRNRLNDWIEAYEYKPADAEKFELLENDLGRVHLTAAHGPVKWTRMLEFVEQSTLFLRSYFDQIDLISCIVRRVRFSDTHTIEIE